jgi:ribosomal protein S17E
MVTHKGAATLMRLIMDLTYVYERCRSAFIISPIQSIQVKGTNNILDILKRWRPFLEYLAKEYSELNIVVNSMREWIEYLDKKYVENEELFFPRPFYIEKEDAEALLQNVKEWINAIINEYEKRGTVLIKEEKIEQILPESLIADLDETTKEDLYDALKCILHLLPTPAAMISMRVAESLVRRYYTKITGNAGINKSWGEILNELEQSKKVKPSILGYLKYLKYKRNEAEHPAKRFTQEESERIFIHIKELLEELKPFLI